MAELRALRSCLGDAALVRGRGPGAWAGRDLGVAALGLLLLLAWDASGADLAVARWFGTPSGFAWRNDWLTAGLLHSGGRALGWTVLAGLALHLLRPLSVFPAMPRAHRLWWLLATLGCLVLIPLIKSRSLVSCPWDLALFGGPAHYVPHWSGLAWAGLGGVARDTIGDGGGGGCFPSGHASGAFSFLTGWFALRGHPGATARRWLIGVALVGLAFGLAQVARGAHYPSHVGWTAWVCWVASALAWHGTAGRKVGSSRLEPPGARAAPIRSCADFSDRSDLA